MPTEKPRVTFTISQERLSEVENYRFNNKIKNQTQAILSLIDKGLSGISKSAEKAPSLSDEVKKVAEHYSKLDSHGREVVRSVLAIEYKRCKEPIQATLEESDTIYFICPGFRSPMSAGIGQIAGDDYPENYRLVKEPPRGTSYIAPIDGNSMEPTYQDGDKLFIHACTNIRQGQIGVFFMDGKQWVKELGDGVLISHNEAYEPRQMTEDIICQGLVLGVCDESYFE